MSDELNKLLEAARQRPFSSVEKEEQRRSFAYGNAVIENVRITRETVDKEAAELQKNC